MTVFVSKENLRHIFLEFFEVATEAEPFFHLWMGQILPSCCYRR
jgi:hypothetical protein